MMRRRSIRLTLRSLQLGWAILACQQLLASDLVLLVSEFPPFTDSTAVDQGLSISALQQFAGEHSFSFEAEFLPIARVINRIRQGDWEATLINLPIPTEQTLSVPYSDLTVQYGLIHIDPLPDSLAGVRIAVIRNSKMVDLLPEGAEVFMSIDNPEQAYRMLAARRLNAFVGIALDGKVLGIPEDIDDAFQISRVFMDIPFLLHVNLNSESGQRIASRLQP